MIDASWRAWAWYWFGHCISRLFLWCDYLAFLYPLYNWAMIRSSRAQDDSGMSGPWEELDDEDA